MQIQSIHGHEVIDLLDRDSVGLTPRELLEAVEARFGAEARFHTCSDEGMTLGQLLAFLIRKEKVYEQAGRLRVNRARVCGGEPAGASVEPGE